MKYTKALHWEVVTSENVNTGSELDQRTVKMSRTMSFLLSRRNYGSPVKALGTLSNQMKAEKK